MPSKAKLTKKPELKPEYLFRVSNHHVGGCGKPPVVDGDTSRKYFSYFENMSGEQAIYVFDKDTGAATLMMGDCGWETVYPVIDGVAVGLVLDKSERTWLQACWLATEVWLDILKKKKA
jgi:hypothetical protein